MPDTTPQRHANTSSIGLICPSNFGLHFITPSRASRALIFGIRLMRSSVPYPEKRQARTPLTIDDVKAQNFRDILALQRVCHRFLQPMGDAFHPDQLTSRSVYNFQRMSSCPRRQTRAFQIYRRVLPTNRLLALSLCADLTNLYSPLLQRQRHLNDRDRQQQE